METSDATGTRRNASGRLRGLSAKLAFFFIAIAFPALLIVESAVITLEFNRFVHDVDAGALRQGVDAAARSFGDRIGRDDPATLGDRLDGWVVRLTNPRTGLSSEGAYVLLELSDRPITAALFDADGERIAQSGDMPRTSPDELARVLRGETVQSANSGGPLLVRTVAQPVRDATGRIVGALQVRLELPLPWRKLLLELSLEWPIILACLVVFGVATAFFFAHYVTRRL
ncbi:MAG TPA: hypothetical protein VFL14_07845, partial [Xanthomonadales bacterium]|nr:hypothetical protein [Xanthomonadales bacterium]